jgi:hypothetical protein
MTIPEIKSEIERLTERRGELFAALSRGTSPQLVAEREEVEKRLAELWDAQRAARARLRFGDPKAIIARARQEERIERAA